jgi:hypothetical protein
MKLKGFTNYKQIVASVARYDYITVGEGADYIMADGGQPNIGDSEPYGRFWGAKIWFEVPQTFAELYNDWRENFGEKRKYGVWNYNEVKILSPEEIPNIQSFEWKAENSIWGTLGINGDEPISFVMLKDCSREHLKKIKELCEKRSDKSFLKIVNFWLDQKCKE